MPRAYCAVYGCLNSASSKPELSFFKLPADVESITDYLHKPSAPVQPRLLRKIRMDETNTHTHNRKSETNQTDDEEDDIQVVALGDARYSTSFHVAQCHLGHVIGKRGQTKIGIENETHTEIKIPRQGQNGQVTIVGHSASNVKAACRLINDIVKSSRMKVKLTHFISIPMNSPEIMRSFTNFQENVLRDCCSRGLEESVFINASKLHLTVGVMSLMDDEEKLLATKVLMDAKEKVIKPILERNLPLKIRMKGLAYMNNDPKKINVLYAKVEECDSQPGVLQQIADGVVDYFDSKGLMKKEEFGRKNVNLHVTLLNSRYRTRASSQDVGAAQRKSRQSFDGTQILEKFGDLEFGVMEFGDIHLSQFGAVGPDGYYQSLFVVSCTQ